MLNGTSLLGPYQATGPSIYPTNIPGTSNNDAEDPIIWYSGGFHHVVYDYRNVRKMYHLMSADGVHNWKNMGLAVGPTATFVRYGIGGTGGGKATGGAGGTGGAAGAAGKGGGTGGAAGSGSGGAAGSSGVLAATPPMGWNSWNTFACNGLNETVIKQTADTFVSSGMQAAGYEYVNLDDCWMNGRDSSGKIQWNTTKFPSGMPVLVSYVHGKGLKIGLYSTPNTLTCSGLYGGVAGAVGSKGYETSDAQSYASWGIDYLLKYDHCAAPGLGGFATMRDALKATGRAIFYSINPGDGSGCPPNTCSINLPTIANTWRIGFDINGSWSSMISLVDQDQNLYSYAGPGHWNDPDMMEVGHGLSDTEGQTHFSIWAILAAPLIAGNDIRSMSAATKATLTNADVIAVDQDPLGKQGQLVASPGTNLQVWSKILSGTNSRAVALLNRGSSNASITVQWSALGIPTGAATVQDLWAHSDLGSFNDATSRARPARRCPAVPPRPSVPPVARLPAVPERDESLDEHALANLLGPARPALDHTAG